MRGSDDAARVKQGSTLAGAGVLLTRPLGQNADLAHRITSLGGRACVFPAIEIQPSKPSPITRAQLNSLSKYDLVVFVSPNAVRFALPLLGAAARAGVTRLAAPGSGTAAALSKAGLPPPYVPASASGSDALLALPALRQVAGQAILIVRGEGGREYLAERLRARGAHVDYAEIYRRATPASGAKELRELLARDMLDAALITSSTALSNLLVMLGAEGAELLLKTQFIVSSARLRALAVSLGAHHIPRVAASTGGEALVAALVRWWQLTAC